MKRECSRSSILTMDDWAIICSKIDYSCIKSLSCTCREVHDAISQLRDSQLFWYLRAKYVLVCDIALHGNFSMMGCCWRTALSRVKEALRLPNPFSSIDDVLSIHILLQMGYDPGRGDSQIFRTSATHGRTEVVKLLVGNNMIDPMAKNGEALEWAVMNGHTSVVKLLLKNNRVDPNACSVDLLELACEGEYRDIVLLLLEDGRVKPTIEHLNIVSESEDGRLYELVARFMPEQEA